MSTPVLYLIAGPNGAGKTTFAERVLIPATGLPFVNADAIAARRWPGADPEHAYEASREAADEREALFAQRGSFITETVFSHRSKIDLTRTAVASGYWVELDVIMVPVELTVARVADRRRRGGHDVPVRKIRERYARLWSLVKQAARDVDVCSYFDNSAARHPFHEVARYERGRLVGQATWPEWTPTELR